MGAGGGGDGSSISELLNGGHPPTLYQSKLTPSSSLHWMRHTPLHKQRALAEKGLAALVPAGIWQISWYSAPPSPALPPYLTLGSPLHLFSIQVGIAAVQRRPPLAFMRSLSLPFNQPFLLLFQFTHGLCCGSLCLCIAPDYTYELWPPSSLPCQRALLKRLLAVVTCVYLNF